MRRTLGWLIFGVGVAGLGYWGHQNQAQSIEQLITAEAGDLAGMARHDVTTTVSGRDITLSGVAHDEAEREMLVASAGKLTGQRVVHDELTLLPRADLYTFTAQKTDAGLSDITGFVPDADARAAVVSKAGLDAGNGLKVASGAPDAEWGAAVVAGLAGLDVLEQGGLTFEGAAANITGSADTEADLARLNQQLSDGPQGYTWNVDVAVRRPDVDNYMMAAKKTADGWAMEGYMPDEEAVASLTGGIDAAAEKSVMLAANAPAGWAERVGGAVAALDLLETGEVSVMEDRVVVAGVAADDAAKAAFDEAVATLGDSVPVESRIAVLERNVTPEFELVLDPFSGLVVSGDVPANLDAAAIARIVGVAKASGEITEIAGADGASQRVKLEQIAPVIGEFENLKISFSGSAMSITGETLFDADPERLTSYLSELVGGDDTVSISRTEVTYAEGYERPNALTGEVEKFSGGYWIPVIDAAGITAAECAQRTDAAVERTRIRFQTDSAEIDSISRQILNQLTGIIGACMKREPDTKILIGGHTDDVGTDEYNLDLSNQRATNVLAALVARGLPPAQLSSAGYGEAQPVAENTTEEGRARNRRTTFEWLK